MMIQEIITYMIIGAAVTVTVMKFAKRFRRKKPAKKAVSGKAVSHAHNCSDCSAECQLRDLPRMVIEKNGAECTKVEQKSKLLQP
ncbi:hypothetical protein [Maribellus sediminis]|uniref:hypothetical protein n=1 Tax=Maribellus sediminis TaxID=2696285 RepID=UPI00143187AD|nr:hypothetical protein [Maribellus sediminis]